MAELRQRLPDAPELAEPPAGAGAAGAAARRAALGAALSAERGKQRKFLMCKALLRRTRALVAQDEFSAAKCDLDAAAAKAL